VTQRPEVNNKAFLFCTELGNVHHHRLILSLTGCKYYCITDIERLTNLCIYFQEETNTGVNSNFVRKGHYFNFGWK
jgi:hypothetical protein